MLRQYTFYDYIESMSEETEMYKERPNYTQNGARSPNILQPKLYNFSIYSPRVTCNMMIYNI